MTVSESDKKSDPSSSQPRKEPLKVSYSRLTTQLANERTFLAWIRTGIALLAFGFVVEKAGTLLEAVSAEITEQQQTFISYSGVAGIGLMLSGAVLIILATVRFVLIDRGIRRGRWETSVTLDLVVAGIVIFITLIFISFLILQASPIAD